MLFSEMKQHWRCNLLFLSYRPFGLLKDIHISFFLSSSKNFPKKFYWDNSSIKKTFESWVWLDKMLISENYNAWGIDSSNYSILGMFLVCIWHDLAHRVKRTVCTDFFFGGVVLPGIVYDLFWKKTNFLKREREREK